MENQQGVEMFIRIDSTTEIMIRALRKFYFKEYEIEIAAADIILDAIFDRFLIMLAEEAIINQ